MSTFLDRARGARERMRLLAKVADMVDDVFKDTHTRITLHVQYEGENGLGSTDNEVALCCATGPMTAIGTCRMRVIDALEQLQSALAVELADDMDATVGQETQVAEENRERSRKIGRYADTVG